MKPGKLYFLEKHLCFYTEFFAETKLVLTFSEIDSILRNGTKLEVKTSSDLYSFSNFENFDQALRYAQTLFTSACPEKEIPAGMIEEMNKEQAATLVEEAKSTETKVQPSHDSRPLSANPESPISPESRPSGKPPFVPHDDPGTLERSFVKFPKKPEEVFRVIIPFTPAEYYKRFLAPNAVFPDIKLYEALGCKDFDDKGWQQVEGSPEITKRQLIFQYKLEGNLFYPFAYTIKDTTLTQAK